MGSMHCPTCGSDLGDRSICPRCGTLAGAEFAIAKMKSRARLLLDERLPSFPQIRPYHFLWACAFIPIVLLPPIVSLSVSLSSMRKLNRGTELATIEWIAMVSAINITISGIVLYKFHFSPTELAAQLFSFVKYITHFLSTFLPIQRSAPRLTPV